MAEFGHHILLPRFWAKVQIDEATGCWVWTAATRSTGYGLYGIGGQSCSAHRVAYEAFRGWIPDGLELDHLCRNRPCVNPDHLEAVTREEHLRRQNDYSNHNRAKAQCPQGHPYDDENTYVAPSGSRSCRLCHKEAMRRYKARRKPT